MSMGGESGFDRISALPDELLCHILSSFPTKTAVRTSVLSSRWRYLYTLVSSLDIDADIAVDDVERANWFTSFVERILLFRSGPSIQRFRLKWHHYIDPLQIYGWIGSLVSHNVQELELCNQYRRIEPYDLQIPSSLFSSETLVVLKLVLGVLPDIYSLKIPANAFLPSLNVLRVGYTKISEDHIEKLLSSCPALDDLVLDFCQLGRRRGPIKLNLCNAALKRLTTRFLMPHQTLHIVVDCPALVYLNYFLCDQQSFTLLGQPPVTDVVIRGYSPELCGVYANENEHEVLKEIKNVQSLEIQDETIQGICDYNNFHLPVFNKLTYLKILNWGVVFDPRCLQYLLAQCVVLETLVFERQNPVCRVHDRRKRMEYLLEQTRLAGLLCHLKIIKIRLVKIEDAEGEALRKMIEFFLSNAEVLEEMTILVRDFSLMQNSEIMRELSTLPRISKKCRVVLNEWRS